MKERKDMDHAEGPREPRENAKDVSLKRPTEAFELLSAVGEPNDSPESSGIRSKI